MNLQQVKQEWNSQADEFNQWDTLDAKDLVDIYVELEPI